MYNENDFPTLEVAIAELDSIISIATALVDAGR
jgi:hypothetical protein